MASKVRRDGSGSIFQRGSDGKWVAQVRYYDPVIGKSRIVRRYGSSRKAARDLLKELLAADHGPAPATGAATTVADYLKSWKDTTLPRTGLAPKTQEGYITNIDAYAIPTLGRVKLSEFTPAEAERWLGRLAQHKRRDGKTISPSTQRGTFNAVTKAMKTAVRDGLIPANPLEKVNRPVYRGAPVPHATADHVDLALKAAAGLRVEPILYLVAFTGMRIGEALSLRWADVSLAAGTATIRRGSLGRESTKTGKVRTVTLLPEVVAQLRKVKKQQRADRLLMGSGWQDAEDLVFTTGTGNPVDYSNAMHELVRVLKKAELPTKRPWHSLRHGLATRLLEKGLPMPVVSEMLGHSSIKVTVDTYGHVNPAVNADVLAAALGR